MKPLDLAAYREALKDRICRFCEQGDGRGHCKGSEPLRCALSMHMDQVVEAVVSVGDSPDLAPYMAAINSRICSHCRQDDTGVCLVREAGRCNLDTYLLPVIEVIEDVARRKGDGAWAPGRAPSQAPRLA